MSLDSLIIGKNGNGSAPPAGPAADPDLIRDTTTQNFRADVLEPSKTVPVLVDFWAPWCGPCRQLTPILEKAVQNARGKVRLVKMNIDDHPQIPGQLGIQSIPAVIAFKNGQPLDGFMGALPESQVMAFIERVAGPIGPSPAEQALTAAGEALAAKDYSGAAGLYGAVLQAEPDNLAALAGLVRCYVARGELEQAKGLLAGLTPQQEKDPAISAARAALDAAAQAEGLGQTSDLERRVAENPSDHQARFDLRSGIECPRRQDGRGRAADRGRAPRPRLERRGRAQAADQVLRGLGRQGARRRKGPPALVFAAFRLDSVE